MNAEQARAFLLALPHVTETLQWGDNLVFRVGDKSIGGKMFALLNLDALGTASRHGVLSFAAGPELFAELIERDGLLPAPYFARAHWVAATGWSVLRTAEWEQLLRHAHEIVLAKLPRRTREQLASSTRQTPSHTLELHRPVPTR